MTQSVSSISESTDDTNDNRSTRKSANEKMAGIKSETIFGAYAVRRKIFVKFMNEYFFKI